MLFKRTLSLVLATFFLLMFVFAAVSLGNGLSPLGGASAQTPLRDNDSDGMNDTWENTYFGDLSQTASGDYDNDTYTNLEEFEAGTNPADPNSHPKEEEEDDNTTIIIVLVIGGGILLLVIIGAVIYFMFFGGGEGADPEGMPDDMGGAEPGGGDFLDEGLEMEEEEEFEEEGEGIPGMGGMPGEEMEEEEEYEEEEESAEGEEEGEEEEEEAQEGEEKQPPSAEKELPSGDDDEPRGDAPVEEEVDDEPTLQEKIAFVKEKFAKGEITQEQFEMVILKLQEEDQARKESGKAPPAKEKPKTVPKDEAPPEQKPKPTGKSTGYECQRCGGIMKDDKKKCPGCGASFVPNQAMCPICESKVPIDAVECRKCGALFVE